MQLVIVAPTGILSRTTIDSISLPGEAGAFTVLPRHAPIIARLAAGTVRYEEQGKTERINISGGFVRVHDDRIEVCAELSGGTDKNDLQTDDRIQS